MADIIKNNFQNKYPLLARLLSGNGRIIYYAKDPYGYSASLVEVCNFKYIFLYHNIDHMRNIYLHGNPVEKGLYTHDYMESYLKTRCGAHYKEVLETSCYF